ncbi:hypothetical protein VNO77_20007 [Canavalia gladiata]|uniref:Uncharacterized protein n=1 Tax=Canavalia gladiata TaxID=3824 RepID=A0AAN9LNV2_CANGL
MVVWQSSHNSLPSSHYGLKTNTAHPALPPYYRVVNLQIRSSKSIGKQREDCDRERTNDHQGDSHGDDYILIISLQREDSVDNCLLTRPQVGSPHGKTTWPSHMRDHESPGKYLAET